MQTSRSGPDRGPLPHVRLHVGGGRRVNHVAGSRCGTGVATLLFAASSNPDRFRSLVVGSGSWTHCVRTLEFELVEEANGELAHLVFGFFSGVMERSLDSGR